MDTKNIVIGLVIGVLLGAVGIYALDMSRFSQLNNQIKSLEEVVDSQQDLLDTQEAAILMVDALRAEVNASNELVKELETYKESAARALLALNYLCAQQTYKLEEALTQLNNYDPEYEPGIEFSFVFGDLSFEDWWEINGGPFEEWWSKVYG